MPIAVVVEPTHASPAPHGRPLSHAPFSATGTWHRLVAFTHAIVGPQPWLAHESPAAGIAWQVPHSAVSASEQNAVAHWPLNEHGEPTAPEPVAATQSAGACTPERNASQACIA